MRAQVSKVDFSDQNFYCGIDIHKKNWAVTIETDDMPSLTFNPNSIQKKKESDLNELTPSLIIVGTTGLCSFSKTRILE